MCRGSFSSAFGYSLSSIDALHVAGTRRVPWLFQLCAWLFAYHCKTAHGVCLLRWSNIMKVLARSELRIFWIFRDVDLQCGELLLAPYEMVETFRLPEPASAL